MTTPTHEFDPTNLEIAHIPGPRSHEEHTPTESVTLNVAKLAAHETSVPVESYKNGPQYGPTLSTSGEIEDAIHDTVQARGIRYSPNHFAYSGIIKRLEKRLSHIESRERQQAHEAHTSEVFAELGHVATYKTVEEPTRSTRHRLLDFIRARAS